VLVSRRRRGFPEFRAIADFRTLAIGVHRSRKAIRGDISVAAVNADDLTDAVGFLNAYGPRRQFFSKWTEANLARLSSYGLSGGDIRVARRAGQMVGIAGLWDQSPYKQTVVRDYCGWMRIAAPLYNRAAPWLGRAKLPCPGEKLKGAYVSLISIADDDRNVFEVLLRELYNLAHCRGLSCILVGLDARDPLLSVANEYAHVAYPSRLHLVEWPDGDRIDEQLDGRPVYVDIATL